MTGMFNHHAYAIDPLCSVIIPAFDAQQYIHEAIDSALSQECDFSFEVIVVDDGSTDRTSDIALRYGDKVQLIQKENGGPGSARNAGAAKARADILVFLDADDKMLPGRLAHQVGFMVACPEVALTFGALVYDKDLPRHLRPFNDFYSVNGFRIMDSAFQRLIVKGGFVGGSTMAVKRHYFLTEGMMREDVYVAEDYDIACKLSLKYPIARTYEKLIWCRRGDHQSLMNSQHTYYGPVKVLFENLLAHGNVLEPKEYSLAIKRFETLSHALIRYEWAVNGHAAAMNRLSEFRELLPLHFRIFWRIVCLCPPVLGRSLRRIIHYLKGQTDHRWEACEK